MNPLESLRVEYAAGLQQKAELERKLDALKETIKLLEPVYAKAPSSTLALVDLATGGIAELGITGAIGTLLFSRPDKLFTPRGVRDLLVKSNFMLVGKNPMASVHQILKRLAARGGPYVAVEVGGKRLYKYDSKLHDSQSHSLIDGK